MAFLRNILTVAAMATAAVVQAQDIIPSPPALTMSFEIDGDQGNVTGTVTAPSTHAIGYWQTEPLPEGTTMDIKITRSCYQLGESNLEVASYTAVPAGDVRTFTDNITPAWQIGQYYTYSAVATLNGVSSNAGSASMSPGVSFYFDYTSVTATSKETGDGTFEVDITAVVPTKDNYNEDLTVEMTALEFYRVVDDSTYPNVTELMGKIDNPVKGQSYTYTDTNPTVNATNKYEVKCVSLFGSCAGSASAFVGFDVPAAPYPIQAEACDGGNKITWTAPTTGKNYGQIKPEDTYYIVYRCWGRGEDERLKIADGLKETQFIDYGADMEVPRAVNYEVVAANNIGIGGSNSAPYGYDLIIGPDEKLPFVETFDGGASHLWTYYNSSYYSSFYLDTEATYGSETTQPFSGNGLLYVDYSYQRGDAVNDLTSYKINVSGAGKLGLSFYYYAIPGEDITISTQLAKDGGQYQELLLTAIGEGTEAGWRRIFLPLEGLENTSFVNVRLHISAPTSKKAIILDEIKLIEYPKVGTISVEYDREACTATLTWEDPSTEYAVVESYEGFVDGVSIGAVETPWIFNAPEYRTTYSLAVKAIYADTEAPLSTPVAVSVPRPPYTEFTIGDHVFTITLTSTETNEVVVKQYLGNESLYKIPEYVKFDEVSYNVVGVAADAYKGNAGLVSVSLSNIVTTIGVGAFEDCSSLRAISFGTGLVSIESAAFKNCTSLTTAIFTSQTVPQVAADAFEGIGENCKGKCPEGMEEDYAAVEGLAPIDFGISGIDKIMAYPQEQLQWFDLQGRPVSNPASGNIYIVRTPAGTFRVMK